MLAGALNNSRYWSGYRGGHAGRMRRTATTGTEEQVAGYTYENMIANAMQLYRDDPMCQSIVDVSSTYLGESRPTATTSDPKWNALATQYYNEFWWPQADARGRPGVDYGELQNLFETWSWLGGDMLFLLYDGQLLPYEGTQIRTPYVLGKDKQITNGVRVGKQRPYRISHFYLTESVRTTKDQKFERIRQNQCIYAGSRNWRPAMLRSVPDLHGVIDAIHAFGDTTDNVQQRIRFESMLFTLERQGALSNIPGAKMFDKNSTDGTQVEHTPAEWGMRLKVNGGNGPLDDQFKLAQMQNPHSNYIPAMEHFARIISAGIGYPYEIVMHIYTQGSYTANRAARLDFSKAILRRWAWRNKVLNQRTWNWRIAKAIKQGELPPAPVDTRGVSEWYRTAWTLPHFPHIDEGKEVLADIKQWGCGQESLNDWAQQRGVTRDQLLEAHDQDIKAMQERADRLGIPLEMYMGQLFTASAGSANDGQPQPVTVEEDNT